MFNVDTLTVCAPNMSTTRSIPRWLWTSGRLCSQSRTGPKVNSSQSSPLQSGRNIAVEWRGNRHRTATHVNSCSSTCCWIPWKSLKRGVPGCTTTHRVACSSRSSARLKRPTRRTTCKWHTILPTAPHTHRNHTHEQYWSATISPESRWRREKMAQTGM